MAGTYERRMVPTADVRVGDLVPVPGWGAPTRVTVVRREGEWTILYYVVEIHGRARSRMLRRKTSGRTTVLSVGEIA